MDIFLPKSNAVLIGILFKPPNKYDFVSCLERTFSYTNVIGTKECYFLVSSIQICSLRTKKFSQANPQRDTSPDQDIFRILFLIFPRKNNSNAKHGY